MGFLYITTKLLLIIGGIAIVSTVNANFVQSFDGTITNSLDHCNVCPRSYPWNITYYHRIRASDFLYTIKSPLEDDYDLRRRKISWDPESFNERLQFHNCSIYVGDDKIVNTRAHRLDNSIYAIEISYVKKIWSGELEELMIRRTIAVVDLKLCDLLKIIEYDTDMILNDFLPIRSSKGFQIDQINVTDHTFRKQTYNTSGELVNSKYFQLEKAWSYMLIKNVYERGDINYFYIEKPSDSSKRYIIHKLSANLEEIKSKVLDMDSDQITICSLSVYDWVLVVCYSDERNKTHFNCLGFITDSFNQMFNQTINYEGDLMRVESAISPRGHNVWITWVSRIKGSRYKVNSHFYLFSMYELHEKVWSRVYKTFVDYFVTPTRSSLRLIIQTDPCTVVNTYHTTA